MRIPNGPAEVWEQSSQDQRIHWLRRSKAPDEMIEFYSKSWFSLPPKVQASLGNVR